MTLVFLDDFNLPELKKSLSSISSEEIIHKYSDDQPRDDKGQWTDGGSSGESKLGEQYHGTSVAIAKIIMKEGIKTTDKSLGYKAAFASNSKDLAFVYGSKAAMKEGKFKGATVAIAVIESPEAAGLSRLASNVTISKDTIAAKYITRVEIYAHDAKRGDPPVKVIHNKSRKADDDEDLAYVTLLILKKEED